MIDWTDAFDNTTYVPEAADLVAKWAGLAATFRAGMQTAGRAELNVAYAEQPRNRMDIFYPAGESQGLFMFIHGGYWHRLDNAYWSHLAKGMLAAGWAVAIPSYTLAPVAYISTITEEIAAALSFAAARIDGPIRIAGHSAGGHLVSRMACQDSPLPTALRQRLAKVLSISGIHDLRPLLLTDMNQTLRLTAREAEAESSALHQPLENTAVSFWVGAAERPELLRQTRIIAENWQRQAGNSKLIRDHYAPGHNHFTVIEALAENGSPLLNELLT